MYAHEVYAYEMHAYEVYAYKVHAYEVHAVARSRQVNIIDYGSTAYCLPI
jgi:hypothetical protein